MDENKNEIDLIELIIKIYIKLKKYAWLIGVFILAGILFAFISHKYLSKNYSSSMVLSVKAQNDYMYTFASDEYSYQTPYNNCEIVDNLIQSINNKIKSKNFDRLSRELQIDQTLITDLISAEGSFAKENKGNLYITEVHAKRPEIFNQLGRSIEEYLNNNTQIQQQTKSDSLFLTSLIRKTKDKIKELDSLQSLVINNEKKKSEIVFYNNLSYITESVTLNALQEKLTVDLHNLKKVEIVDDFYLPYTQERSFIKMAVIYVFAGIFMSLTIIFLIFLNQKAKKYN